LKPSSREKINEAMGSNAVESPSVSDTESNNPYDVLRDDDDEIPTDAEKNESDDDGDTMSTQNSAHFSPSESDYESAHDTMSLAGKATQLKRKTNFSDDGSQSNQEHNYTLENAAIGAETQTTIVPPSLTQPAPGDVKAFRQ
jgi:hypothetical protein